MPSGEAMPDLLPVPPPLGWRARVEALLGRGPLRGAQLVSLAVSVLVLVGVGTAIVVWVVRTPPAPESVIPQATASSSVAASSADPGESILVQAAGAVVSPGVYRLDGDARVVDVIDAAGGLAPGADPNRLSLAAKVSDGERVYVPLVGEALPASPSGAAADSGPIDLNTADEAALDALPGVGPATAKAIVAYRESHGPFTSVDQLLEVRGIGPAKLDQLADLVRV
jgi:competence protein ComEA